MKTKETLIGTVITNKDNKPSMKITNVLPADNKGHFRTEYDYVIQVDNKPEKHTVESLGLIDLPKSFENSTRKLALTWFRSFPTVDQQMLTDRYYNERYRESLTGREIEEIWLKETTDLEEIAESMYKPNQKQFTQFSPELFQKYINKFSDEDKLKAFEILNEKFAYYSHEQMQIVQKSHDEEVKFLQNKILELSNHKLAFDWWDNLPVWGKPLSKEYLMGLYYSDDIVTPERIEEIWKKEINQITENVL